MSTGALLFVVDTVLINAAMLLAFLVRYGLPFPEWNFSAYEKSFAALTLIQLSALLLFGVFRRSFRSSWELFQRIFLGSLVGVLLSVAFVYAFRSKLGAFPSSIFALSFLLGVGLIFAVNRSVLKAKGRICKHIVILGQGKVDDLVSRHARVERKSLDEIRDLLAYRYIDEIVISEKLTSAEDLNMLLYLKQKLRAEVLFCPVLYAELLPERINGQSQVRLLKTFVGKESDFDEFLIRMLDVVVSLAALVVLSPVMLLIALLIKATSRGPVLYTQTRVGKDGKTFVLNKFRTMRRDAEKDLGPVLAKPDDPRVTRIGRILRASRLDELPQLINILLGQMSLVGPRPERPHFVKMHKALQGLRLAVKPGLTGLAQVRSFYDLHPKHKIKYDFLYIQRRSLALNVYILLRTVPVLFSKKGW